MLILGETGSGKGVLAGWLHANGPRSEECFLDLNCAGLSRELLESELFGHEKGAFTGAVASKPGLLEVADRGTFFLDEIGDLDLAVQPKLLKVLEEKTFRRLGEVRDRHVDIWLIAATHQDLAAMVEEKRFRSDLYFRISTLALRLPPLRERVEDIPVLAEEFLLQIASDVGRAALFLSPGALRRLQNHPWPGNIRELRNVLERAALLSSGSVLEAADLGFDFQRGIAAGELAGLTLDQAERRLIERARPRGRPRGARRGEARDLAQLALPADPEVQDRRFQNLDSASGKWTGRLERGAPPPGRLCAIAT